MNNAVRLQSTYVAREIQKAMVFVDGTNLFHRLMAEKLKVTNLSYILDRCVQGRRLVRAYLYTSKPHYEKAQEVHGCGFADGFRIVYGHSVLKGDGNSKEKGVDALLVADLIYHAAMKNYDFASLVTVDTDFVFAIRRVEDFGCTTKVVGICTDVPDLLREACDSYIVMSADELVNTEIASRY